MAKLGEGDQRWIVKEREDGANVNNWHWAEKNLTAWSQQRLTELLVGVAGLEEATGKGWCKITGLDKCEGEASVSNRKGKRIIAFELNITFKWSGSVDYDDVSGELQLPYVSEDVDDSAYEIKWTAKEPKDDSHKAALRHLAKTNEQVKAALKTFTKEIYEKGQKPPEVS